MEIDSEKEVREILNRYRGLLRDCKSLSKDDKKLIRKAFNTAVDAHKDMRRKSGEPYIYHPIDVARIAAKEIGLGTVSVVSALLHDVVEDSEYTIEDIERLFGIKVAKIINGLTKISDVYDQNVSMQAENYRKMLLTLSDDVRVILIKLADRLHNMRTLNSMPKRKQLKISSETLYLYAPLAHRLGLYAIKTELEDLGLKYTENDVFRSISEKLEVTKKERVKYINKFVIPIRSELNKLGFNYSIKGRPKSIYSIRNKMNKQGVDFEEVFDKFAIRIVVESRSDLEKSDCWRIYSIVTDHYKPNPDRLRDWISTPKSNGYEALHTTVMGPNGKWVEVQIRTSRMNEIAEKGFAAHWKYKGFKGSKLDEWIDKVRELLENPEVNAVDFVDDFKMNLFSDEIYVFTPAGDLKTLPKNASPIDFAYEIHTQIGSKCLGAKVNGKLVPLSYQLKSGDQVEIITSNKQKPKEDWINFVKTSRAKSKIKNSLKEEKKQIGLEGKVILERKLKHIKIPLTHKVENELVKFFKVKTSLELFYRFGVGILNNNDIRKFSSRRNQSWYGLLKNKISRKDDSTSPTQKFVEEINSEGLIVFGENKMRLDYKFAKCCKSIYGDNIFGFTTINEGVKVHNKNCPNAIQLRSRYAYRILPAFWNVSAELDHSANIKLKGIDQLGLVNNVTKVISNQLNVNIVSINFSSNSGVFEGEITVYVKNKVHLENLLKKLQDITGIESIERI